MRRLFLALWPDAETRSHLVEAQQDWQWPFGARPTPAQDLHLTLHFIGPVVDARVALFETGLEQACEPFGLAFGRHESWGNGIAALCPTELPEALRELHDRLEQQLLALGHEPERRRWRPHVTLARRAEGAVALRPPRQWTWHAAGYRLVESGGGYRLRRAYGCASATMRACTPNASSA